MVPSLLRVAALISAALLVSACACKTECTFGKKPAKAVACTAPGFSMAGKKTYKWVTPKNGIAESDLHNNAFWRSEARAAIDADLARKGYTKVQSGKADFLVGASGMKLQAGAVVKASATEGYKMAPGLCKGACPMKPLKEGDACMALEVIDPASKLIVWRSCLKTEVDEKATPEQRERKLKALAAAALKDFPAAK